SLARSLSSALQNCASLISPSSYSSCTSASRDLIAGTSNSWLSASSCPCWASHMMPFTGAKIRSSSRNIAQLPQLNDDGHEIEWSHPAVDSPFDSCAECTPQFAQGLVDR